MIQLNLKSDVYVENPKNRQLKYKILASHSENVKLTKTKDHISKSSVMKGIVSDACTAVHLVATILFFSLFIFIILFPIIHFLTIFYLFLFIV